MELAGCTTADWGRHYGLLIAKGRWEEPLQ